MAKSRSRATASRADVFSAHDEKMMRLALRLAARGQGHTRPNPLVGAVVCDPSGAILATGWHKRAGLDHAEVAALARLDFRAPGATLYVNLEPCNHHGRTPPCTDAILKAGIKRVVVAMRDPFPLVDGRGLRRLRAAGIRCDVGLLAEEAMRLNEAFVCVISRGRPFVVLKLAQTLDGKLATRTGASQWITGVEARAEVHRLRSQLDAILVGARTVVRDDPRLTVRLDSGRRGTKKTRHASRPGEPIRIVLDGRLSTPTTARALPAWILCAAKADRGKARRLEARGGRILEIRPVAPGRIDVRAALARLAQEGIQSLLVEGGAETAASLLEADVVDRIITFIAPKIIGGRDAVPAVGGVGVATMDRAIALGSLRLRQIGQDVMISADVHRTRRRHRPRSNR